MAKFIVSTDSCADFFKGEMEEKGIRCIVMKRIVNGREIGELYDGEEYLDKFYAELKSGALPTTTQLNAQESEEYFAEILAETEGDIVHVTLSSGISGTYENVRAAAEKLNAALSGRRIYVVDSLLGSGGQAMLVDRLVEMRDGGIDAADAVKKVEEVRARQQAWFVADDLFHLKRGGRIGGFRAALGALLKIKPILVLSAKGKIAAEHSIKGAKAARYLLEKFEEYGVNVLPDFFARPIYMLRASKSTLFDELKRAVEEKYPQAVIKEVLIGPVVGAHTGAGTAAIIFEGAPRLNI